MQISNINTSSVVPVVKATSSPQAASAPAEMNDKAEFNLSADSFSSLVHQASQMPEVRSEVVDAFKARIKAGHYPSQDIVDGLTRLMGGGVMQAVKSGTTFGSTPSK